MRVCRMGPGSPTMMPHLRHARRGETRWRRRITSRPTPVASIMHPIEYSTGDGAWKRGTRNGPQARQHHPRPLRRATSPAYLRRVRFKWPGMDGMLPAMLKSVQNSEEEEEEGNNESSRITRLLVCSARVNIRFTQAHTRAPPSSPCV